MIKDNNSVEIIDFSTDDEKPKTITIAEFFKNANFRFEWDWGNGHAVIISFEEFILTEQEQEQIADKVKAKLLG